MTIKRLFKSSFFSAAWAPFALLVACIAAYGLLIPFLGFFWDDWQAIWWNHTRGLWGFIEYFSGDRPFLAWIYIFTNSLLNSIPWQWQIAALISRWLTAVLLWWTLKQIWVEHQEQVIWVTFLFLLYPGFKQQPISIVWTNGLLLFAAQIASLGLMLKAVKNKDRYWLFTISAMLSSALCNFSTEYFVGLEFIRPVIIWMAISKDLPHKIKLKKTIIYWIPFLILLGAWGIWRVFILGFPTYVPGLVDIVKTESGILFQIFKIPTNIFTSGWVAWIQTFRFPAISDLSNLTFRIYWVLVVFAFIGTFIYLIKYRPYSNIARADLPRSSFPLKVTITGILTLCCAGLPFWVANLPIDIKYPYDRFTLSFMLGSALLIVGLLEIFIRTRLQKIVLLSLLISMAIGSHFLNANTYRRDWETQKSFFWQMTWRIPALKPGTLILTRKLPLIYYTDNSLTAPLNWIYAPDNKTLDLPYFLADMEVRMGRSLPKQKDLAENIPIHQLYRNALFSGNTSNIIMVFFSPPGCLRVLDPSRDYDLSIFPREIEESMFISHPSQIIPHPSSNASLPEKIFGKEPEHDWCYYFEAADLARQRGKWKQVVELGDEAFSKGLSPADRSESIIFIESYFHTGDWVRALNLIKETYSLQPNLHAKLCSILDLYGESKPPDQGSLDELTSTRQGLGCKSR